MAARQRIGEGDGLKAIGAAMIICCVIAGLVGWSSARHYSRVVQRQHERLVVQSDRISANQDRINQQEYLTCKANRTLLMLLNQSLARARRAVKVDPPKRKAIDRTAIVQLEGLVDTFTPAVVFCR